MSQTEELRVAWWYALHVRSNQEKAVSRSFYCREIEHYLPCYQSLRQWKDRRVKLQMPLFPGYIFLRAPLRDRMQVLTVPNVVSLVGVGNTPSPIPHEQIDWIEKGIEHGAALPHEWLAVGERVLIMDGPMSGLEGTLVSRRNSTRVVVALTPIARAFSVEIDLTQLRALSLARACPAAMLAQAGVRTSGDGGSANASIPSS